MKRGSKKIGKETRKRITVASTFINSEFNNNSSSQTIISLSFTSVSILVHSSNLYWPLFHSRRA